VLIACVGALAALGFQEASAAPEVQANKPAAGSNEPCAASGLANKPWLTLSEARCLMVALVNRDRATMGLPPVELDLGPSTIAGQRHAEDMASHGYLGHWGTDGSTPEQRYNQAGGADMVLENASCLTDEAPRPVDPTPKIAASQVALAESMFFNEVPPNDGHRKNILRRFHKRLGVGVAQFVPASNEIAVPCFSQEFIDAYGSYAPIPATIAVGQSIHVEGMLTAPAHVAGVGLARVPLPAPVSVPELNRRRSYPVPPPYQMYWPPGYVTPVPLRIQGEGFAIDVPVSDRGQPGLYELSIWAKLPGEADFVIVSLRTMRAE
jgi:uncharacterized protein YkwD